MGNGCSRRCTGIQCIRFPTSAADRCEFTIRSRFSPFRWNRIASESWPRYNSCPSAEMIGLGRAGMGRVFLVNPSAATIGYSFLTPRWLFVLAGATPTELLGDAVLIDECLERFDANLLRPGDIVGIGISTGNCVAGYRLLREAKKKGAIVIMGGIHATIFPDE